MLCWFVADRAILEGTLELNVLALSDSKCEWLSCTAAFHAGLTASADDVWCAVGRYIALCETVSGADANEPPFTLETALKRLHTVCVLDGFATTNKASRSQLT